MGDSAIDTARNVFLVQSLQCYGGDEQYGRAARKLETAGFIRCRSKRAVDGKYWEVWLGYPWRLNGSLKDASKEEILRWLMKDVGPGEITVAVQQEHWGAGVD